MSLTGAVFATAFMVGIAQGGTPPRSVLISIGNAVAYTAPKPDKPTCQGSNRAIDYYRQAVRSSHEQMGRAPSLPARAWWGCDSARRRAIEWRAKAAQVRAQLEAWHEYQYDWRAWLPRGWYGIGSCETGYGGDPNWSHNSGAYQGAFGFAVASWDNFVPYADPKAGPYPSEAYLATPRQQYEVALAIYRRYGLSGWGCRGAFYR